MNYIINRFPRRIPQTPLMHVYTLQTIMPFKWTTLCDYIICNLITQVLISLTIALLMFNFTNLYLLKLLILQFAWVS